ncbi:MAG: signal peptidase I [Verrucomicrobia bacterium]|nr:signal peptidase I [Verrucomicrobiota bacterium]
MWILSWFLSKTVREAVDLGRQIRKLVRAQRDLLSAEAIARIGAARVELNRLVSSGADRATLTAAMRKLEQVAMEQLKPYPHARWRENVEVLLVTAAVVLALRTFFFQPMAIPTGSAQPTLYGIEHTDLRGRPEFELPRGLHRMFRSWWHGEHYYHVVAREGGSFRWVDRQPKRVLPLVSKQRFRVGNELYTVWFPPDSLPLRAELRDGQSFRAGDEIIRLKVVSGDHLFVNRLIYNFRHPHRGEIIVFASAGLPGLTPDTHYIKRLIALGNETVSIGDDRHVVINGERLDASTPGFENVYGFDPNELPRRNHYSGHVNGATARLAGHPELGHVIQLFPNARAQYRVRPDHYLVFGDNTMNSTDSRMWGDAVQGIPGDIPEEKVIGRASFVFWPISSRFGWGYR